MTMSKLVRVLLVAGVLAVGSPVAAQDVLPYDNGLATYHTSPRYRDSETHPLRVAAYILHPIGWVAREVIFRPFSYFASSTETTKSVLGYRDPYDYRQPECFSADDSVPDCRSISPYNFNGAAAHDGDHGALVADSTPQIFFPDVNFDFDKHTLNALGQGRVRQIAETLKSHDSVRIVLEGHADFMGSEEYNMKLGMNRANAVRDALTELGVAADRLATVSFGESRPLNPDQTDWARAMNRRVHVAMPGEAEGAAPVGEWKEAQ